MERNFRPQRKAVFDYVSQNSFWFRNLSKLDQTKKNAWLFFALLEYVVFLATEFNNYPCSSAYYKIIQLMNSEESII